MSMLLENYYFLFCSYDYEGFKWIIKREREKDVDRETTSRNALKPQIHKFILELFELF